MNTRPLPVPTVTLIEQECREFDDENQLVEEALRLLLLRFPYNTERAHVLLKVLTLNELYSTRVRDIDVQPLARHIAEHGIDSLITQGSFEAVDLIVKCPNMKSYLSFASKFCSWHNPRDYPIWDGNVRACLWAYKQQDEFATFHNYDLWDYESFRSIMSAFQARYGLELLSLKEVDKFLWRLGDRILRQEG